jgi:hypothetical protein
MIFTVLQSDFSHKLTILTKFLLGNMCWLLLIIILEFNDHSKSGLGSKIRLLYAEILGISATWVFKFSTVFFISIVLLREAEIKLYKWTTEIFSNPMFLYFFPIPCIILSNFAKETIFFWATVDFWLNMGSFTYYVTL